MQGLGDMVAELHHALSHSGLNASLALQSERWLEEGDVKPVVLGEPIESGHGVCRV